MTTKPIVRCWEFESSSSRGKNYETLLYADLTTSCNCMGWTRRTAPDGSRSCKHTRLVDMHRADAECVASHDYRAMSGNSPTAGLLVHEIVYGAATDPSHNPADFGTTKRKLALA